MQIKLPTVSSHSESSGHGLMISSKINLVHSKMLEFFQNILLLIFIILLIVFSSNYEPCLSLHSL